jgi:hypothetical protein
MLFGSEGVAPLLEERKTCFENQYLTAFKSIRRKKGATTFHQLGISSTGYFVNLTFHQLGFSST